MKVYYSALLLVCLVTVSGCAALFGWNIHAPGLVSQSFYDAVQPADTRVALYVSPAIFRYESKDRGSRLSDPQTYYIGEALGPILIEAFQQGFSEFVFIETSPTAEILQRYGIEYLVYTDVKGFKNRKNLKGQKLQIELNAEIYNTDLEFITALEVSGASDADKVFAKKGGPEVNLNMAIENAAASLILYLQDAIRRNEWD